MTTYSQKEKWLWNKLWIN